MASYWVFVVIDHKGKNAPNAAQVFEERLRKKFWALNQRAPNAKRLEEGDKVVLCLAGKYCRGFAGSAVLGSRLQKMSNGLRRYLRGLPSIRFTHCVRFKSVKGFNQIKCLGDYVGKISLLKSGEKAQLPQRSIVAITEDDFNVITEES